MAMENKVKIQECVRCSNSEVILNGSIVLIKNSSHVFIKTKIVSHNIILIAL